MTDRTLAQAHQADDRCELSRTGIAALSVLMLPVAGIEGAVWSSPRPFLFVWSTVSGPRPEQISDFHVYDCAQLAELT